jgi:4-hydroxybenzoate polyprenyltransferase
LFLRRRLAGVPRVERVFHGAAKPYGALWLRALRLHQWAKNLLIFVPLMASHRALEVDALRSAFLAFLWFGLCASATYLINDLLDLDADRTHKRKRQRPFASGDLSIVQGMVVALALLSTAFIGAALTVDVLFVAVLGTYALGTLWYSFTLKQIAMVDVLTLAGLYTVRVIAGSAAIEVEPSFWLLAFSMFVFLSLATVKRYTELRFARSSGRSHAAGRGYRTDDLPLLLSCGTSAGFVAVLVLALYVNLGATELYRYPQLLWLLCPLVLYWICRVWRKAHRDELHDDPLVFAVTDRPSLAVVSICLLLMWLATWARLG